MRLTLLIAMLVGISIMSVLASACFTVTTHPISFVRGTEDKFDVTLDNNCTQPAMVWMYSGQLNFDKRYVLSAGQELTVSIPISATLAGSKTYPLDVYVNGGKATYYLKANVGNAGGSADYTILTPISISTPSDSLTIPVILKSRASDSLLIMLFKRIDGKTSFWKTVNLAPNSTETIDYSISSLSGGCRDIYFCAIYGNTNITRKTSVCVGSEYAVSVDLSTGVETEDGEDSLVLNAKVKNLDTSVHEVFLTVDDAPSGAMVFAPDKITLAPDEDANVKLVVRPFNFSNNVTLSVYVDNKLQQQLPIDSEEVKTRAATGFITLSSSTLSIVIIVGLLIIGIAIKKDEKLRRDIVTGWNSIASKLNSLRVKK